ncbi:hypothetical protein [Herbaspirillum sp. YR522]|uniref:hypothetical protein n=1 Tax=Herbaspirillum sp. YR522 TaxID=1144342 RepID=UPI00026F9A09|nr:hypothetical protein [Herbaspirillum sp. YR522]EJN02964.1 hypothetical protein PMI40_02917 [Herbaspirillum sp. YR522]
MSTFQDQLSSSMRDARNPYQRDGKLNSTTLAAQAGVEHAAEFQMWVSQQATSLAKLKIFSTMAKGINDQQ